MIIRVWGIVNDTEVEFTPVPDRPGYWEGYAPRMPGLQDIEIWAESDSGMRGHLECTVMLEYHAHTEDRNISFTEHKINSIASFGQMCYSENRKGRPETRAYPQQLQ